MDKFPLHVVGVDFSKVSLRNTHRTLRRAKINHHLLPGDVRDPDTIAIDLLREHNLKLGDMLNVRSFVTHNRTWVEPTDVSDLRPSKSTGIFCYRGREIPNSLLELDLRQYFKRWGKYLRFGLLDLELHTIPPSLAARHRAETPTIVYDVTHGYSDQYILELPIYLECARDAGLEVVTSNRIPKSELATVSINYFRAVRGKEVFELPDGSVVERITSPNVLPEHVKPYWKDHHALYVIRNDSLGYQAYLGMHKVKEQDGVARSIGGTALEKHPSPEDAMIEALLLSRQMSYKAAMIDGLDVRGGKFVINFDNDSPTRRDVLDSAAKALEWIKDHLREGIFTGQDVNISAGDAYFMYERTPSSIVGVKGDPSKKTEPPTPPTAAGVLAGMRAAVEVYFPEAPTLKNKVVSLAGLGNVGSLVLKGLLEQGATVVATEPYAPVLEKRKAEFAEAIAKGQLILLENPDAIYDQSADFYCPCTSERRLLDAGRVERLKKAGVRIVAGSSNTQLADESIAKLLHDNGIVYVEDVVINAGGLMGVAGIGGQADAMIYGNTKKILLLAKEQSRDPHDVFNTLAQERVEKTQTTTPLPDVYAPEIRLILDSLRNKLAAIDGSESPMPVAPLAVLWKEWVRMEPDWNSFILEGKSAEALRTQRLAITKIGHAMGKICSKFSKVAPYHEEVVIEFLDRVKSIVGILEQVHLPSGTIPSLGEDEKIVRRCNTEELMDLLKYRVGSQETHWRVLALEELCRRKQITPLYNTLMGTIFLRPTPMDQQEAASNRELLKHLSPTGSHKLVLQQLARVAYMKMPADWKGRHPIRLFDVKFLENFGEALERDGAIDYHALAQRAPKDFILLGNILLCLENALNLNLPESPKSSPSQLVRRTPPAISPREPANIIQLFSQAL